jgi:hypothetical protein
MDLIDIWQDYDQTVLTQYKHRYRRNADMNALSEIRTHYPSVCAGENFTVPVIGGVVYNCHYLSGYYLL